MMFSGCFSSKGTGQLIAIRGIKTEDYIKIRDENLQLSAKILIKVDDVLSSKINDPIHMSKSVTAWLQKKKITVFRHGLQWVLT